MTATRLAAATLFLAVMLTSAVLHGRQTGRWVPLPPLDEFTARLAAVPPAVGDWAGQDHPLDADELARAGVKGHLFRQYRHRRSGEAVGVFVVCGRPGPISVHTPDVCYQGAGYTPVGEAAVEQQPLPAGATRAAVSLWRLRFRPPGGLTGRELDIRWGWLTPAAGAAAPANPRVAFADQPALYKLYVLREGAALPTAARGEIVPDFLAAFLPALETALVGPGKPGA